jgi:hypothetical protein
MPVEHALVRKRCLYFGTFCCFRVMLGFRKEQQIEREVFRDLRRMTSQVVDGSRRMSA